MIKLERIAASAVSLYVFFALGCASLPVALAPVRVLGSVKAPGGLSLGSIAVERAISGKSIERELARLAPLLFMRHGRPLEEGSPADSLAVDIFVVEREFVSGTQERRSLMVEASLRRAGDALPLMAARQTLVGSVTAASSEDVYASLDRVVDSLLKALYRGAKPGDEAGGGL